MNNEQKIIKLCAEIMGVEENELSLETSRDELDEFDSLSIVQIIGEMEEVFQKHISEEALDHVKIEKIGDFLKLLED